MQRIQQTFFIENLKETRTKLITWADQHKTVCWLDSNENKNKTLDGALAIDIISSIKTKPKNAFYHLEAYIKSIKDYAFGFLSYDLKNDIENLQSNNIDSNEFPDLFFFQPKKIIEIKKNTVVFKYPEYCKQQIAEDWNAINTCKNLTINKKNNLKIRARISKENYINQVEKALAYIHQGKVYELNFCQEFYADNSNINPLQTFNALNRISKAPFTSYFKHHNFHILCASPERFIKKDGQQITSEPIKGTAKRELEKDKDLIQINQLKNSKKEIAENIMIVDLVRNDLSHIARKGSVQVEELCKIYTYKQVHQMTSKITCQLKKNISAVTALKKCYPMGSMTGAPKIASMNFIEELEDTKRGVYSGTIGYFTPEQNFDFNVVIRSILYNKTKKRVSFSVGSAITAKAIPEQEYNECILKAKAMRNVLDGSQ